MFTLRYYQEDAVSGVRDALRRVAAVLLALATGAGKTVVFSYIARAAAGKQKSILILAHRDKLIKQASAKLDDYGVEHGIIMAGKKPKPTALVQVASVQTMIRRIQKYRYHFDLIIIDEAHLSAAASYMAIAEEFPRAKIIGVTGSPCRLDNKGLGRHAGGLFDELIQGISIGDLIDEGFLVRPAVFGSPQHIDLSGVRKTGGDYNQADLEVATDKPGLIGDAVSHYQRICPGVPAVAWCVSIKHAEHVSAQFNAAGIKAIVLSGKSSEEERDQGMADLESGAVQVIAFCQLMVEGVDCPAIGCVIMLRPTMSLASFLQVIGRGLRPIYAKGMPLDTKKQRHAAILAGPKGPKCYVLDHAGLTARHGFADDLREWSLDGMRKKKGKKAEEQEERVIQCPACYYNHPPGPCVTCQSSESGRVDGHPSKPHCPACGHEYEIKQSSPEVMEGTLQEITPEMREAMRQEQRREQGSARTVEALVQSGMSRGRAVRIIQAREEKQALINGLVSDIRAWSQETGRFPAPVFGVALSEISKLKPKALKELREQFDAHRAATEGEGVGFIL